MFFKRKQKTAHAASNQQNNETVYDNKFFIELCYLHILERQPSSVETNHYLNLLNKNHTHAQIMHSFLCSAEYLSRKNYNTIQQSKHPLSVSEINAAFQIILGRLPTPAEINDKLTHIKDRNHLRDHLLWSKEFKDLSPVCSPAALDWQIWANVDERFEILLSLADRAISHPIYKGEFEKAETEFIKKFIKPGNQTIDVGANIGYFSLLLASLVGTSGKVTSFEPIPPLAQMLSQSIKRNKWQSIINLNAYALGDKEGLLPLEFANIGETPNPGGAHFSQQKNRDLASGHSMIESKVLTLDTLFAKQTVDFIKIDVEGAEPLVIAGGVKLLSTQKPLILAEIHKEQLEKVSLMTSRDFINKMDELGFNAYHLDLFPNLEILDTKNPVENIVFAHPHKISQLKK